MGLISVKDYYHDVAVVELPGHKEPMLVKNEILVIFGKTEFGYNMVGTFNASRRLHKNIIVSADKIEKREWNNDPKEPYLHAIPTLPPQIVLPVSCISDTCEDEIIEINALKNARFKKINISVLEGTEVVTDSIEIFMDYEQTYLGNLGDKINEKMELMHVPTLSDEQLVVLLEKFKIVE